MIGAVAILAVTSFPDYGITWDWVGDLYVAERNVNFLTSANPMWLDFDRPVDLSMQGRHLDLTHADSVLPFELYYFGAFLSSLGCKIFFQWLGVLDPVAAHMLPNVLMLVGTLVLVFGFLRREWSSLEGLAVIPAIAFQPRFWDHLFINLKDFPYACIMAGTLLAARAAFLERSWKKVILASFLFGIACATKLSAGLIPIILAIWVLLARSSHRIPGRGTPAYRGFWIAAVASPLVALVAYVFFWPWMWLDPLERIYTHLHLYLSVVGAGPAHFQWDRLYLFVSVQPPGLLLFALVGISVASFDFVRGRRREQTVLLLLWLALPVLRVAMPRALDYDGVRHHLEHAIPLGIFTAIGFAACWRWLRQIAATHLPQPAGTITALFLLSALPAWWAYRLIEFHPHQILYFNFLAGGTRGAAERWEDVTDYWGSSYRQGSEWLERNAEPGALISVPVANHIAFATRYLWLREDLRYLRMPRVRTNFVPESEALLREYWRRHDRPLYVMYLTRPTWYHDLVYLLENSALQPVEEIRVDGVPILKIFRLDPANPLTRKWVERALGAR